MSTNPNPESQPADSTFKPRPDDILANLPEEDQDELYHLLLKHPQSVVVKMIAEPRPAGYDLQVSQSTLSRFFRKRSCQVTLERQFEWVKMAAQLHSADPTCASEFQRGADSLINQKFFELLVNSQHASDKEVLRILNCILKFKKADLAERKLAATSTQSTTPKPAPTASATDTTNDPLFLKIKALLGSDLDSSAAA